MPLKLNTASGGSVSIEPTNTASNFTLTVPAQTGTVVATDASGNVNIDSNTLYVDATNDRVGIGTNSPSNKLQVSGSAGSTVARFTDGANGTFLFQFASSESRIQDGGANNLWVYDNSGQNSKFYTNNTERMRIDSSGTVLIAKTSTTGSSNLQVAATAAGKGGINIAATNSGTIYAMLFYTSDGVDHGYISYTTSGTSYNTTSDYRLKENIAPMTGALAKVSALKPCTYNWKSTGEQGQGFIAHELAEVAPECVTGEKDELQTYIDDDGIEQTKPRYQGIDVSFLVATLTAAIQEQQAIITAQASAITALEARLTVLENK